MRPLVMTLDLTPRLTPWAQTPVAQGPAVPEPVPLPHPEIPQPPDLPPGVPLWFLVATALLILLIVALVLWLLFKPKTIPKVPQRDPLQSALRALRDLRSRAAALPAPEIGHRVSEILRIYYLEKYSIPAPFRTTPELFPGQDHPELPPRKAWRAKFEPMAQRYDEMAFAPAPATPAQAASLIESAIARLEEDRS